MNEWKTNVSLVIWLPEKCKSWNLIFFPGEFPLVNWIKETNRKAEKITKNKNTRKNRIKHRHICSPLYLNQVEMARTWTKESVILMSPCFMGMKFNGQTAKWRKRARKKANGHLKKKRNFLVIKGNVRTLSVKRCWNRKFQVISTLKGVDEQKLTTNRPRWWWWWRWWLLKRVILLSRTQGKSY